MSELKPCPFCGGEARLVNCGSPMVVCLHGCCQIVDDKNSVEHWNTRPIEDELNARITQLTAELARRDASLLTEGEQREILSYIRGNYDRDKIPCWLLDLIDGVVRRDEIITRLKEAGENLIQLANFNNMKAVEYTDAWCALMDELGNLPR